MEKTKTDTLSNGIRIATKNMPHMHSVAMGVWIATGGRYETRGNTGISHFIEHLLFKGTKKRSCKKISESIEGVGGLLNAYTSEEYTFYMAKVASRYFSLALDILFDIYKNSTFDPREIERERGVIKEEINMYHDMPDHHIQYDLVDGQFLCKGFLIIIFTKIIDVFESHICFFHKWHRNCPIMIRRPESNCTIVNFQLPFIFNLFRGHFFYQFIYLSDDLNKPFLHLLGCDLKFIDQAIDLVDE